jgi:hypothetical protein
MKLLSRDYTKSSESIKANYRKKHNELESLQIYCEDEFIQLISQTDMNRFKGKTKHRTLLKENPRLYKSIIFYTDKFKTTNNLNCLKTYWVERLLICENKLNLSNDMLCRCKSSSSFDKQTQKYSKQFCKKCWISPCSMEWFKYKYGESWKEKYDEHHLDADRLTIRQKIGRKSWYVRKGRKFHGCLSKGKNEVEILNFIEKKYKIKIERGVHVDGYYVDGYCKDNNTVYEVYEKYHKYQESYDDIRRVNIMNDLNCEFVILYDNNEINLDEITIKRYDKN